MEGVENFFANPDTSYFISMYILIYILSKYILSRYLLSRNNLLVVAKSRVERAETRVALGK